MASRSRKAIYLGEHSEYKKEEKGKIVYYKQTYRNSCLLDTTSYICGISPKKACKDLMTYFHKDGLFFKHGFFKFSPAIKLLRDYSKFPVWKGGDRDDGYLYIGENIPMILGVNFRKNDDIGPLHCLYYDGKETWDGYSQCSSGDIRKLKICYSIICYDSFSTNHLNHSADIPEAIAWMSDNCISNKSLKFVGQCRYLKVI